jgi:hypothetical protein
MSDPDQKFNPVAGRRYLVTDQCLYQEEPAADYNPLDPHRSRHIVCLVDVSSGTIVHLMSGSTIEIVQAITDTQIIPTSTDSSKVS